MKTEIQSRYEPESFTWSHLLADPAQRVAAVIDPVLVYDPVSGRTNTAFADGLLALAAELGYRIEWVLETHAHADHLSAGAYIRDRTGAKVAIGRGICAVQETFARIFNLADFPADGSQFDRLLDDGDIVALGGVEIRVIATPGHTGDSVTYLAGDAAFIGDTLFAPGYGTARCDFPGGDAGHLYDSIQRIYRLPKDTRLFLCHDYPAKGQPPVAEVSLAEECSSNVHLKEHTPREEFVAMRTARDAGLSLPRLILPALQVNIRAGAAPAEESNGAAYLRIPFNRTLAQLLAAKPTRR